MAEIPDGTPWWIALPTAIGLLGYKFRRQLIGDSRQDRADKKADDLRDWLVKRVDELTARCDGFATQKNEAIREIGVLKGKIEALESKIALLETEREEMRLHIEKLEHENVGLRASVAQIARATPIGI